MMGRVNNELNFRYVECDVPVETSKYSSRLFSIWVENLEKGIVFWGIRCGSQISGNKTKEKRTGDEKELP